MACWVKLNGLPWSGRRSVPSGSQRYGKGPPWRDMRRLYKQQGGGGSKATRLVRDDDWALSPRR